ncbi:hypothetical protein SFK1770_1572 [Shigella flexneri K-1770]|nr:hypothetical protein SFK1770_1572 [Shigella flexneri K-1770]
MAGCVGEPKGSPVSVPGYANPAQFATSSSIGIKTPKRLKNTTKRMFLQHHFCSI